MQGVSPVRALGMSRIASQLGVQARPETPRSKRRHYLPPVSRVGRGLVSESGSPGAAVREQTASLSPNQTDLLRFPRRIFVNRIPAVFPLIPENGRSGIAISQKHERISYKFGWRDNSLFISSNGGVEPALVKKQSLWWCIHHIKNDESFL